MDGAYAGVGDTVPFKTFRMGNLADATASQLLDWPTKSPSVKLVAFDGHDVMDTLTHLIVHSGIFSELSENETLCRASFTDLAL